MTATSRQPRAAKRRSARSRTWTILRDGEPVRWSKVQAAQARIASGYYEREEVERVVVRAIARELKKH